MFWTKSAALLTGLVVAVVAGPALATGAVLSSSLTGTGIPTGSGSFRVEADAELGDFCYMLAFKGLGKVKDAVILPLDAAPGAKPLVTMELTGVDTDMCIAVEPKVLEPILAEPGKYAVVVRSVAVPQGVARGVLGKP